MSDRAGEQHEHLDHSSPVDHVRAGRILSQVLDLAESLPARRRGPLEYPSLRSLPDEPVLSQGERASL